MVVFDDKVNSCSVNTLEDLHDKLWDENFYYQGGATNYKSALTEMLMQIYENTITKAKVYFVTDGGYEITRRDYTKYIM